MLEVVDWRKVRSRSKGMGRTWLVGIREFEVSQFHGGCISAGECMMCSK
jgi:hypothetical protein